MRAYLSLALLLIPGAALAAPPKLVIPAEVRPAGQYVALVPETDAVSVLYVGLDSIDPFPSAFLKDPRSFLLDCYGKPAGRYRFAAVGASKTGEQVRTDFAVLIGPQPVPPVPPGPNPPGPNPPGPDPPPIPGEGFRVLILLESADRSKLTPAQLNAIDGGATIDYLNKHCVKEGGTRNWPEWRVWDVNIDASKASSLWQSALTQGLTGIMKHSGQLPVYPWVVVSNGKAGYNGPMPADFLKLLKTYGGE